jgi:putative sterol carrier protein
MENKLGKKLDLSLPKDKSLEAYKEWVTAIAKRLTKTEFVLSESEWIESWKDFWKGEQLE